MKFTATEAGFENGMGGASNSKANDEHHYILFGMQEDPQHPEYNGAYFEYDDQKNGKVNSVEAVSINEKMVCFKLLSGTLIEIKFDVSAEQWGAFLSGIRTVFTLTDGTPDL